MMKRLRSSDDLASIGDKGLGKDSDSNRSSSHRSYYYKAENGRKGLSSSYSSARYERVVDDERESLRSVRKRSDYHSESFDRRKGFDRYRDCGDRGGSLVSSPRSGYGGDRIPRSESFCGTRREFPKGFRSDRDRSRREGSVSSWRRFGGSKDFDDGGRNSSDSVRGSKGGLDDRGTLKSPRVLRETKSPAWSKDSGSEQSKSVEVKKNEELQVESSNSSEMEEGELEPEPKPKPEPLPEAVPELEPENEAIACTGMDHEHDEAETRQEVKDAIIENQARSLSEEKEGLEREPCSGWEKKVELLGTVHPRVGGFEPKLEVEQTKSNRLEDAVKDIAELPACQKSFIDGMGGSGDEFAVGDGGDENDECFRDSSICEVKVGQEIVVEKSVPLPEECKDDKGIVVEKSVPLPEECKDDKGIDLEVEAGDNELREQGKEVTRENGAPTVTLNLVKDELTRNFKDKGKSVAVSPCHDDGSRGDEVYIDRGPRNDITWRKNDMEGPSTWGFELFASPAVKKAENTDQSGVSKLKDKKLSLEPLDLSLSLPNVLLPIASRDQVAAPGSPSCVRSIQSLSNTFRTNSDGFTASMSFSGSQQFIHNPSCSLTHNSLDNYEQSVGSHPIFQGVDQTSLGTWQTQSLSEPKQKEVPLYQRELLNGNGSLHQSHSSQSVINGHVVQGQHVRVSEGASKNTNGLDHQLSFHNQLSVQTRRYNDIRSPPSQSVGSRETGSEYSKDKKQVKREKNGGGLYRISNQKDNENVLVTGTDFVETMITMIISEPIHVMAGRFHEMTEQSISCLRGSIYEVLMHPDKCGQLSASQKALQKGSDISLEMLLKCHRVQLEIMVALKTGLHDFLRQNNNISTSDLAEIFLNLRCKNLDCCSSLPVDECDCKVCSQKNGFCSNCMCLICSKFDLASNTCSWVGCDVCLHWCHTDCGLRESLIRNGRSATGAQGMTEMQFHCVACGHPSEMFGFVKEVFQNFIKIWPAETLSKELEYVRRIFGSSKDAKGKQLHGIADQMLVKLANGANLPEIYNPILLFLSESDSSNFACGPILSMKEQREGSTGIAGWAQEPVVGLNSVIPEKTPRLERAASIPPHLDSERNDKHTVDPELQCRSLREPVFDELESIVRIKQAEAKMFQARADDARREAEGLKRIAIAKNEKIEEEFTSRITKLRLAEAEEMRTQKVEQLQALERAHREYFNMKMRMEADIKDLLLKMEATKRHLAM